MPRSASALPAWMPPQVRYRDRAFAGLNDDPGVLLSEGWVRTAENVLLENGIWIGRPGLESYGTVGDTTKRVKLLHSYTDSAGVYQQIAYAGGKFYKWEDEPVTDPYGTPGKWTEIVPPGRGHRRDLH